MLLWSALLLAQLNPLPANPLATPTPIATPRTTLPPGQEIVLPLEVRPLPGGLDEVPVFNSNSPEIVSTDGILLSTFPSQGKRVPTAHLNYAFEGRFDIFAHHIGRPRNRTDPQTLYQGLMVSNPTNQPVRILVMQANSYLTGNAPFVALPKQVEDRRNRVFSGPGSRMAGAAVRYERGLDLPPSIEIPPGAAQMLVVLPITASSGRSTLMRLYSTGKVYVASLAMFAKRDGNQERPPTLAEWQSLLATGELVSPRDRVPTPPGQMPTDGKFIYGRVAGVARGSQWTATLTDNKSDFLNLPQPGRGISFAINTLDNGTLGTRQIQSAPMLVRYADTAYRAHGNYAITYSLTVPLRNSSNLPRQVTLAVQTPLKEDKLSRQGLRFLDPPAPQVFFRGTVSLSYNDEQDQPQVRYFHLVQRRGQQGEPLLTLTLPPQSTRKVLIELVYPPDATPPQVLTIQTLGNANSNAAVP